jgi:F-type H+-transporting ATPase subunit c
MKRYVLTFLTAIVGLLIAAPVFAQTGAEPAGGDQKWIWITAGFAMALAAGPCGYAQSKVAAAACEGLARNPGARPGIQLAMLLGLVFIETLVLFTFAMIFAKVHAG